MSGNSIGVGAQGTNMVARRLLSPHLHMPSKESDTPLIDLHDFADVSLSNSLLPNICECDLCEIFFYLG